jgi:hypothetical protein
MRHPHYRGVLYHGIIQRTPLCWGADRFQTPRAAVLLDKIPIRIRDRFWLAESLYLPEVLYLVILIWLFFSGPGWLSVDHLILSNLRP